MNILLTLIKKELNEAWRDRKLIWLPIVISILAISQPLSLYYMPEILEFAGNLPEGAVIELPVPSGEEVLAGTLSQLGTIGTAIFVLSMMGAIVQERNNGSLSLVMARPVQPIQYIASKFIANLVIVLFSFIFAYSLTYYYTNLLFNNVSIERFTGSLVIYCLWLLLIIAVTLFIGTIFKQIGGVAGGSIVILALLALVSSLFPKYMSWSPANAQQLASEWLLTGNWADSTQAMVFTSIALFLALFLLSVHLFYKYERY